MPAISTIRLRCTDPAAQRAFYCDTLGMKMRRDGTVGYCDGQAGLSFEAAETPYVPGPNDLYWKSALSVPDIDLAEKQLKDLGVDVGTPRQAGDVAYLAHFKDPEGFTIELIDHWFKGARPPRTSIESGLGGGPCLSLLTLRAAEIAPVDAWIRKLGLVPLATVPLPDWGFDLYFYAFTDEQPPNTDLRALENRTWVYQRPYTVLEIQHVFKADTIAPPLAGAGGYAGALIRDIDFEIRDNPLRFASQA